MHLAHDVLPLGQGSRSAGLVGLAIDEVAFKIEVVVDVGVDLANFCSVFFRLNLHRSLSSSERQVTVLTPVVGPASDLLLAGVAQLFHRRPVRAKAIGDDLLRRSVTLRRLVHEAQCGVFIAGFGDVAFEDIAFLIDRLLQIYHLAVEVGFAALRVTYISSRRQRQWRKPRMREMRCRRT